MIRSSLATLLFLFFTLSASAQTGIPPFSSSAGGPDVVDLANLNVHVTVPIIHKPGRGLNFGYDLSYDSTVWSPVSSTGTNAWTPDASFGWRAVSVALTGEVTVQNTLASCFVTNPDSGLRTKVSYPTTTYRGYKDPFGTFHPAVIVTTDGYENCDNGPVPPVHTGSNTANDGSGYLISVDESASPVVTVTRPNGVIIKGPGTTTATIVDPNGNELTTSVAGGTTTFTDTLGVSELTVTGSGTPASPTVYTFPSASGGASPQISVVYTSYSVQTKFGCSGITEYGPTTKNLVSEIDLPDGSKYLFTYEATPTVSGKVTGRVASVKFPAGATIGYTYTGGSSGHITCADGTASGLQRTTPDTGANHWDYARTAGSGAAYTTTTTDPTTSSNQTVVKFQGILETQRFAYQGSSTSGTLLQTVNTCYNGSASPCTGTAVSFPITQRSVIYNLPGGGNVQARHLDFFNSLGLITESDDYDFGAGAPQTTALKKTFITYASLGSNLNSYVSMVKIQDGAGTVKYRQDMAYDSYDGGLLCVTGASQHDDSGHGCSFTARGNATSVTTYASPAVPSGGITKNFTYDSLGNLRTAQLNCCQQKSWAYSSTTAYAYPDSVTSGSSSPTLTTSFTYNNNSGLLLTSTDPNNLVTTLTYDSLGRVATSKLASNPTTDYTYVDHDNSSTFTPWTIKVCSPVQGTDKVCQNTILDSLGRPVTQQLLDVSSTLYSATDTQYDSLGRAYKTSNPYTTSASYWTTASFDPLGRLTSTALPDTSATTYSYADATVTTTDPAGKQRKMQSDALGRLVSVWEPDPSAGNSLNLQTTYSYNTLSELTGVSQGSQTRTYVYDALGRLTSTTTPEAGLVCFGTKTGATCNSDGYDSFDNLIYRTDARGVLTAYGYDSLNRLYTITYNVGTSGVTATPSVTLTYGTSAASFNNGRLISMTDGPGSEAYSYNSLGQLTQLQKVISATTYTTGYAYNLAGELTSVTYPSGRVVQQNVDTIGRLCSVGASSSACASGTLYASGFGYNAAQQATGFQYGNGIYASFGFSADRLLLNCLDYSTTNRSGSCAHDGTTKFGLNYSYAAAGSNNGQIASITDAMDNGRSASYGYDALYRLISTQSTGSTGYPQWKLTWDYDRYGNIRNENQMIGTPPHFSVTVDGATNHITDSPYAYDSNGNMTNDGSNTLVYDAENRVLSASNGGASGAYVYDGNNVRVKRCLPNCSSPTTTVVYIFSGSRVIAEYDNGAAVGSPTREYIYSGATLLAKIDSSGTSYYHQDHLSNRLVTNSSGATVAQLGHYPFGESWYNTTGDKLLFTTYDRASESGNDYAMMRSYVSRLARFSSPDPLSGSLINPQSLNRYAYALSDGVNLKDPSGLGPRMYQDALTATSWNQWLFEIYLNSQSFSPGQSPDSWQPGSGAIFGALIFGPSSNAGAPIDLGPAPQPKKPGARNLAQSILEGDNDCSRFFNTAPLVLSGVGNNAITGSNLNPGTAAEFFYSDFVEPSPPGYFASPYVGAGTNEFTGRGAVIVTNSDARSVWNSAFAPSSTPYPRFGNTYSGGSLGGQVVMLLHELGHTLGLIPPDGPGFPSNQSQLNTQTIVDHCLSAIRAALGGS